MSRIEGEKTNMKHKTQNQVKEHEEKYWHIPKFGLLPILGLVVFGALAWGNLYLINWEQMSAVWNCNKESCERITLDSLQNIYPLLGQYVLFSLIIISLVAFFKGGYSKLKNVEENGLIVGLIVGLIAGLIVGLIVGLIWGLIAGLIWGLIAGLIWGLIAGLIVGLIWGLIVGLIVGLIWGLIVGLIVEFEDE